MTELTYTQREADDLIELTTSIAAQQGSIVRVQIRADCFDKNIHDIKDLYLPSWTTVTELKEWLGGKYGVPPGELVLQWETTNIKRKRKHPHSSLSRWDFDTEEKEEHPNWLLFGPLSKILEHDFGICVHRQKLTNLQQSFFNHAGYEDWEEMDEAMDRMLTVRKADHCWCGNTADEFHLPLDNEEDVQYIRFFSCTKCLHHFSLSETKYIQDNGHNPRSSYHANIHVAFEDSVRFSAGQLIQGWIGYISNFSNVSRNFRVCPENIPNRIHEGATIEMVFTQPDLQLLSEDGQRALRKLEIHNLNPQEPVPEIIRNWKATLNASDTFAALLKRGAIEEPPLTDMTVICTEYGLRTVTFAALLLPSPEVMRRLMENQNA